MLAKVEAVVAGYDFRFGAGRAGDAEFLRAEGDRLGFAVEIVERIVQDEDGSLDAVSSTATRAALEAGDVALARDLLGHPYFVRAIVRPGDKRGRLLGFPTANLALDQAAFATCLKDPLTELALQKDLQLGELMGLQSTPTMVINGRKIVGGHSVPELEALLEAIEKGLK